MSVEPIFDGDLYKGIEQVDISEIAKIPAVLDIDNELMNQASLYSFWAAQEAEAKSTRQAYEGFKSNEIRVAAAERKEKITEATISRQLLLDEEYKQLIKHHRLCRVAAETFRQRKDMLQSLAANLRRQDGVSGAIPMTAENLSRKHREIENKKGERT